MSSWTGNCCYLLSAMPHYYFMFNFVYKLLWEKLLFFNFQESRNHKEITTLQHGPTANLKFHFWLSEFGHYMGEVGGREDRALSLLDANFWWCKLCVQVAFNWPANFCNIGNNCNFCFCIWAQKRKWPQLPIEFMEMRSQVS